MSEWRKVAKAMVLADGHVSEKEVAKMLKKLKGFIDYEQE